MSRQTEELFLDFKQAVSDGKSMRSLHPNDRRNLGKAISAFGNSEGGVLVWGVECSRDLELGDVAKAKVKVQNVHRFLSWLENAISGCTIPSHNKVRNHIISCDDNGDGFVATYIPKSDIAPLMTTTGSQIYIRSGSNNVPAPYAVIAGMFGKRPQPNIELVISNKTLEVGKDGDDDFSRRQNGERKRKVTSKSGSRCWRKTVRTPWRKRFTCLAIRFWSAGIRQKSAFIMTASWRIWRRRTIQST